MSPQWRAVTDRVDDLVAGPPWSLTEDPALPPVARSALDLRWGRVVRRGRRLRDLPPAGRHAIRIEAKKLRYGAQFFSSLYAGPGRPDPLAFADTVAGLQDALGALNDVAMARDVLAEVDATPHADRRGRPPRRGGPVLGGGRLLPAVLALRLPGLAARDRG